MEEFTLNYLVVFKESNKNDIYVLQNLISPKVFKSAQIYSFSVNYNMTLWINAYVSNSLL